VCTGEGDRKTALEDGGGGTCRAPACSRSRAGGPLLRQADQAPAADGAQFCTPHTYMQTGNYVHRPNPNYLLSDCCLCPSNKRQVEFQTLFRNFFQPSEIPDTSKTIA